MSIMDFINPPAGDGDSNSDGISNVETAQMTGMLLGISHAMTDFLLSNDDIMQRFAQLILSHEDSEREVTDTDVAELYKSIDAAHDVYVVMQQRAQGAVVLAQLSDALGRDGDAGVRVIGI
jgi:hypothetical protein